MENRGTKGLALAALIVGVVGLTIGFAAFSTSLTISSSATVTATEGNFKVGFTGTPTCEATGTAVADNVGTASGSAWSGVKVTLKTPGDSVTCKATVANTGEYDAYLNSLTASDPVSCTSATSNNPLLAAACGDVKVTVSTETTEGSLEVTSATNPAGTYGSTSLDKLTGTEEVTLKIEYTTNASGANYVDEEWTINVPTFTLLYESVNK